MQFYTGMGVGCACVFARVCLSVREREREGEYVYLQTNSEQDPKHCFHKFHNTNRRDDNENVNKQTAEIIAHFVLLSSLPVPR